MKKFRKVLFVHTDAPGNEAALRQAFALASANGGDLAVLSVTKALPEIPHLKDAFLEHRRAHVDQTLADAASEGIVPAFDPAIVTVEHIEGEPFVEIIRKVLREDRDIVIKAADGKRRVRKKGFSTQDLKLLRQCPCPIWLFSPGESPPRSPHILAAIDPSQGGTDDLTRRIVEIASSLREQLGSSARLDFLHCWEFPHEQTFRHHPFLKLPKDQLKDLIRTEKAAKTRAVEAAVEGFLGDGEHTTLRVLKGDPEDLVPNIAKKEAIDLVIMGTLARTGVSGLFIGNTAETILTKVSCSVLAIKPAGFRSAVTLD